MEEGSFEGHCTTKARAQKEQGGGANLRAASGFVFVFRHVRVLLTREVLVVP
jgi:hypothetical protein